MSRYVVDASVAIKWFFQAADDEDDLEPAGALLRAHQDNRAFMYQPPHFIAEVAAVLARKKPAADAKEDIADLLNLDMRWVESTAIYLTACDLAIRLNHHLFDTLYHAVALHVPESILVTADLRYYQKAQAVGQINLLSAWRPPR